MSERDDTSGVIDTLEDLFVFLGASDVAFKADHYSYPISTISRTWGQEKTIAAFEGSPHLCGLFNYWEVSQVFFSNGRFCAMSACDLHWSKVQEAIDYYRKWDPDKSNHKNWVRASQYDSYSTFTFNEIDRNGKSVAHSRWSFAYKGNRWHELGRHDEHEKGVTPPTEDWLCRGNEMLMALASGEPAYWLAKIKMERDLPGLALISDATGIHSILKLRDIPEGRKRRAALIHWVSDHWRKDRKDPEMETYVRKHLRGAASCTYKDFSIDVQVAKEETVEAAMAKRERVWMRANPLRPDRRKRLIS